MHTILQPGGEARQLYLNIMSLGKTQTLVTSHVEGFFDQMQRTDHKQVLDTLLVLMSAPALPANLPMSALCLELPSAAAVAAQVSRRQLLNRHWP